jgi:CheY-like chemotaxis protein
VTAPVRAVVVEDSLLQRTALVRVLEADGTIRVVGQAASADEAVRIIARDAPDVVTMDLEMPGGTPDAPGGLLAIERVMATRAVPILVLSAHVAARGDTLAIDALAAGAVDVFPKDPGWPPEVAAALRRRLAVLSRLQMVTRRRRDAAPRVPRGDGVPVVGLAASTGGPSALRAIIPALAAVAAPILVVQHIHPAFAATFAEWLEHATGVPAVLAEDGMLPRPGRSTSRHRTCTCAWRPRGCSPSIPSLRSSPDPRATSCCGRWRSTPGAGRSAPSSPAWATTAPAACSRSTATAGRPSPRTARRPRGRDAAGRPRVRRRRRGPPARRPRARHREAVRRVAHEHGRGRRRRALLGSATACGSTARASSGWRAACARRRAGPAPRPRRSPGAWPRTRPPSATSSTG